ncbi:hypothetical protein [Falsiporphyromonas endometrii]|uniref:DUF4398 domain-containing protein n=1 Tax=Falsiporphyromonas endometrii TaxID=1387297 RepID=A0ABV9K8J2_9PORP
MKTISIWPILLGIMITLSSLSCSKDKGAKEILQEAQTAYDNGQFAQAVSLAKQIDTLAITNIELRKEALKIRREARIKYNENRLDTINATLDSCQKIIDLYEPQMLAFKANEMVEGIRMYYREFIPQANITKNAISISTDTIGRVTITSTYVGSPINHTSIKINETNSNEEINLPQVKYDKGLNYRYKSGGKQYEIVTYPDSISEVFNFIKKAKDRKNGLKCEYIRNGQKTGISIRLSPNLTDKMSNTIEIAQCYANRFRLKRERTKIEKENKYLDKALKGEIKDGINDSKKTI